jgi:replication factor C large subunit
LSEKIVPWTEQYRPSNLDQVVGNDEAVESLRKWFDSWSIKAKKKAAVLHGPAGIGKTSSVVALAKERGYELVEMNASDKRNKDAIFRIAGSSSKEGTLMNGSKGKRILLIDEVDGITGREDRGGVKSLVDVIKLALIPIICTANDAYSSKLSPLRKISKVISYKPIHLESILKVLKKIGREQKLTLKSDDLKFIAENAHGDMRSAINDLEGTVLQMKSGKVTDIELLRPFRDQKKDIQKALTDLFNSQSFIEGKRAIDGLDVKYDELLLWVFENAYKHTSDESLPEVYETLASADRFLGRIMRRQSWRLLSYFFDLVSGGVVADIDKPAKTAIKYAYPQKISMYAWTKFERAMINSIATNIAEKTHVSKSAARTDSLYLVEQIMNGNVGNAAQLADWLELDDNQLKKLVHDTNTLGKIKRVLNAYDEERAKNLTKMKDLQYSSLDEASDEWSSVMEVWEKKEAEKLEEEENRKAEEKKLKAEAKKKAKAAEKAKQKEKEESEKEDDEQVSLDQFL